MEGNNTDLLVIVLPVIMMFETVTSLEIEPYKESAFRITT